jgi:outer membrane usher protein
LHLNMCWAGAIAHRINARICLNALLLSLAILTLTPSVSLAVDTAIAADEVLLDVFINQQRKDTVLLLRNDGRLFAGAEDLRRWRVRLPNANPLTFYGENFYALDALAGLTYRLDDFTQTLAVQVPPSLFDATRLTGKGTSFSAPTTASLGGFLNYDVYANHAQGLTSTDGLLELGGFGSLGTAQTRILALDLNGQARAIRLDTTWTRDQPMQLDSLRFGDAISGASSWGGAVRFGGVQWATNFSVQPGFVTFPLPVISGEAALPSTVDLYVDSALRMRRKVPSGPFSIEDLPVPSGQGDARLVVRDILGREQIITQPFDTTSRLLKQGLHDYSYEVGFVRRNFGIDSNNYGRFVAVGTHRLGLTEQFTGEVHGEMLGNQQTLGLGGVLMLPATGVLSGSLAASHSDKGVGGLLGLGFRRQSRSFSFGVTTQLASQRFVKLGMQPEELAPRQISQAFVNLATTDYGAFSARYTQQAFRDREDNAIVSGSYSREVGSLGNLRMSVMRFLSGDAKTLFSLNFSMLLGKRTSANISTSAKPGREQAQLQLGRSLPAGSGMGYRLVAGVGDSDVRRAELNLQNQVGSYVLGVAQSSGQTAFRGSASGGVAFLGGSAFLSRRISDSFAVVKVPDYSDVAIYVDNQLVAQSDANGSALLPRLRAYQINTVRIEQADLPLDAKIDTLQLDAVPYFRSGLLLKFPVKRSRGALLTVVLENGEPLPAGSLAQIIGDKVEQNEVFPAGMGGELYLTGLAASNRLRVTWLDQSCEFVLPFPESTEPLPYLGSYTCTTVEP